MEIKRIDPYLAEWSVDGAVALAVESGGVQFLVPDAAELLKGDVQWRRMRSPDLAGRVVDMKWSPTGLSTYYECVLAAVLDTGDAVLLENSSGHAEPWNARAIEGVHTACAWSGPNLLLGGDAGRIAAVGADLEPAWTSAVPVQERVLALCARGRRIGAVLADNSVWQGEAAAHTWERVLEPSRFRVYALQFGEEGLVAARTDGVWRLGAAQQLAHAAHYVPGHLLVRDSSAAIVHTDGRVSPAFGALKLPEIRGRVFGAALHPELPVGLLILGPVTNDWEYSIVSWQWAKTAFFVVPGALCAPRATQFAAQMYWLALLLGEQPPTPAPIGSYVGAGPAVPLPVALDTLFTSEWFDAQRLNWYASAPERRGSVVAAMRTEIARLVCAAPQHTELDRAIARWYAAYLEPEPADAHAQAGESNEAGEVGEGAEPPLKTEDDELHVLELASDVVRETFIIELDRSDTIVSQAGHVWKRCSLTLVPLLSLNTRVSLDHEFSSYKTAPSASAIADALLATARFCVFTGTQWERPRF